LTTARKSLAACMIVPVDEATSFMVLAPVGKYDCA
jgi:hypothetical protein